MPQHATRREPAPAPAGPPHPHEAAPPGDATPALARRLAARGERRIPRIDAFPEENDYQDTGCDLYPSCLHCPLPRCRYDHPGGAGALLRSGRDAAIARRVQDLETRQARHHAIDETAREFGISRRTVFRILAADRATRELELER